MATLASWRTTQQSATVQKRIVGEHMEDGNDHPFGISTSRFSDGVNKGIFTMEGTSNVETPAGPTSSQADDNAATRSSSRGYLALCPKYVQKFVNKECHDKDPTETYKEYCARLLGVFFEYEKWKNLCSISWKKIETVKSPNDMDMTALENLFHVLFMVKNDSRNTSAFLMKLKNLKDIQNSEIDPDALGKLEAALDVFIQEAGSFYSLPAHEIQHLKNELKADIQASFCPGEKRLLYACTCMAKEGLETMKQFLQSNFETENLLFSMGKVKRRAVFHKLEVLLREGDNDEIFSYAEIFERNEKFIIVSGVAGAGKSTLLENIALNFVELQTVTSSYLQDFDLLLYIQCRDHTTKTLSQVLMQQYDDVWTKLGEDIVLKALFKLKVLFLVDGYDEYSHSMTVLQEVIKKAWRANCRVIITTRHHSAERLGKLLSWNGVNFAEFEIAPLLYVEQQLSFLKKYEPYLPGSRPPGAVQESFRTLPDSLQILFTEPLKLLQFCNVYINCPNNITSWTRATDVANATFLVYKELLEKKLINAAYPNLDIVIEDLFLFIGEEALNFLRDNTLAFTKEQVKEVQRKCDKMLQAKRDIKDLDINKVLSSVLKMKRPPTGKGHPTYSFSHEADQKYFASKYVVHKMKDTNLSVRKILSGKESRTGNW
ncbi:P-loop containing nucleoside triphosphate hydrolase [Trinorchestia longiramus]|nr:P-loop containing nucleoside triphosphate hydrolase [Trinorchestia longiramus]